MLALVKGLPGDAAVWRQDKRHWSQTDELLATLIEQSDYWQRRLLMAWGAKRLPPPPQINHPDRPGRRKADRKVTTDPAEIRQFFSQHSRR